MIKLSKCYLDDTEYQAVQEVLAGAYLGMGKQVFEFENELKNFLNTSQQVICVNSGTAALHLALSCIDLKPGDEVLVPTLTFAASFQAISAVGAIPIACDVKSNTLSIDLESAKKFLSKKTKAIMPVHYASHVESINELYNFANQYGLRVVEDAAHAFGTLNNGVYVGSQGDIVCFSFDGIKNITCGEGGAIVTGDLKLVERLKDARLLGIEKDSIARQKQGRSWNFDIKYQGYRYHMSDIMAAIGRTQLRKISQFKHKRQHIVSKYLRELSCIPELIFLELDYENILPHIFVVRVLNNKRDELKEYLHQHNIETGIHYKPNHLHSYYKTNYALKNAELIYQEILTLPLHVGLHEEEQNQVIQLMKRYFQHA